MWGRCYEEQGMPPDWPWVQAIRSYVREREPEQLRSEMGAGAADIAEVESDVKERLPDLRPPPALDSPEQARFRLFDSITAFLKSASQKQPLVLVLDDLHWADQPSLLLLQFVARELGNSRLLLIGTYRDVELSRQHPLAETLGELTRERLFQRVLLRGLSQQDVSRFIEVAAGVDPPSGLAEAVHTQTEGNPLFVTEVVRLLVQEGELTQDSGARDSWTVHIPEGVREVIGRRLNRLSQRCNETLTIASVIGREFELRQLTPLVEDISEDRLLKVLEEALSARVIEELPQAVGRYQFTHALIQETLAEELTLTRRAPLHARIAEALEEMYGQNAEAHASELAYHFVEAETITGTDRLVRYSEMAGRRALASYAHVEALGHFQRALNAKEGQPTDDETAALLFGLGRAQLATLERYQVGEAVASLTRAFEHFAQADISLAVAVAEYPVAGTTGREMEDLIDRALAMVTPDSHEAGRLLSRYGCVRGLVEGGYDGAQEAFSGALAIARREGDETLELRTLAGAAELAYMNIREEESLQWSLSAIELARRIDDPRSEVVAHFYAVGANYTQGNLEEAVRHATEVLPVAEKLQNRYWLTHAIWRNDIVHQLAGDWRKAREFSDRGLAISGQSSIYLGTRVLLEYETGEFGEGEVYLNRLVEAMGLVSPATTDFAFSTLVLLLAGRITGDAKWIDVAGEAAKSAVVVTQTPIAIISARAALGLVASLRGEAGSAGEQYQFLQQYRGIVVPGILRSVDRFLGILSQTMDNMDQATEHFEAALAFCRKAGFRPELAWTCCDYADTLLQRNESGYREKAMSLLDESLTISSELGMRPLMERVLSRREILKA